MDYKENHIFLYLYNFIVYQYNQYCKLPTIFISLIIIFHEITLHSRYSIYSLSPMSWRMLPKLLFSPEQLHLYSELHSPLVWPSIASRVVACVWHTNVAHRKTTNYETYFITLAVVGRCGHFSDTLPGGLPITLQDHLYDLL